MSEHQKLLDAARSAVDLLTTVLTKEADDNDVTNKHLSKKSVRMRSNNDCSENVPMLQAEGYPPNFASNVSSALWGRIPAKSATRNTSDADDMVGELPTKRIYGEGRPHDVNPCQLLPLQDDVMADSPELNVRVRQLKNIVDRKLGEALAPRTPSQVAKVTPQRLVTYGSRDDVTDHSIGSGGGSGRMPEDFDHHMNSIAVEQALASSLLVLENAKLREQLTEVKSEIAALHLEMALKEPPASKQDAGVQTCGRALADFLNHDIRINELSSDEDTTDYLTTYSNSSPDRRSLTRRNGRGYCAGQKEDIYFYTSGSTLSTPGTLARATTVSSSGGPARRKLELPKSLKKGVAYLSITSYEEADDSSASSPGCCPFLCFKPTPTPQKSRVGL